MFQTDLLRGKRILITGGGTGLGAAMARRFGELGATLLLCGRRQQVLEDTAAQLRSQSIPVSVYVCDVRDAGSVNTMLDAIWQEAPVDVLVNNAAATFIAQSEKLSPRAADAILATTLHGAMYCTLGVGNRWIEGGHKGVVLSILSTSTITGRAFTVPSAMAKSGLLAMTKSLAVEWGPKGVRLVAIAPGPFPTAGATRQLNPQERASGNSGVSGTDAGTPAAAPGNPMGRVGEPTELANLASYLVSDYASYVNGEMVVIDGGLHLRSSGAEDLLGWSGEQWEALRNKRG